MIPLPDPAVATADKPARPTTTTIRNVSLVDEANVQLVTTLIDAAGRRELGLPTSDSLFFPAATSQVMLQRKIWVKRVGASSTLVQIGENDLVDDARDTILRKYANSLGKTFDSPDVVLHIITRADQGQNRTQRVLGPEEELCKTLDSLYPGGQTVDEALIIDTPQRRTPRPSPRPIANYQSYHAMDEYRPQETGTEYFPPMPVFIPPTVPQTTASTEGRVEARTAHHHHSVVAANADHPRSISVLNTGQIAPLPSPGGRGRHHNRPKYGRQPTTSPTLMANPGLPAVNPPLPSQPQLMHRQTGRPRLDSSASEAHHPNGVGIPPAPPLPSPPAPEAAPTNQHNSQPPTPSGAQSVTHRPGRPKKLRKATEAPRKKERLHQRLLPPQSSCTRNRQSTRRLRATNQRPNRRGQHHQPPHSRRTDEAAKSTLANRNERPNRRRQVPPRWLPSRAHGHPNARHERPPSHDGNSALRARKRHRRLQLHPQHRRCRGRTERRTHPRRETPPLPANGESATQ